MAEGKNRIIVYRDWITTFDALTDEEAGRLIKHFFRYVNDKNPEAPDRITALLFEPIKQTLKRDLKNYESICLRNRNNGQSGGRPKQTELNPKKPSGLNGNPKKPDRDKDSDKDNDTDKKKKRVFISPSVDEVKIYFIENGYSEESAIKAFNYYDVANWIDSKGNKVRNWKQKMQSVWFKPENKAKSFMMP